MLQHYSCARVRYQAQKAVNAGQHIQNINWVMAFLILCWFVITIIYIVVRATKSLKLGKATAYGVWVLVMEVSCPTFSFPADQILGSADWAGHSCSSDARSSHANFLLDQGGLSEPTMTYTSACTEVVIPLMATGCELTICIACLFLRMNSHDVC